MTNKSTPLAAVILKLNSVITRVEVMYPLLVLALFVGWAGVPYSLAEAYGKGIQYQLQIQAFLEGHLWLSQKPFGLPGDWIWANGMQQNWNLGIPALETPFYLVFKLLGYNYLPEQIALIAYVGVVALCLTHAMKSDDEQSVPLLSKFELLIFILVAMLSPILITMIKTHFAVYELAVVYQFLTAILAFSAVALTARKPRLQSLVFIFALGFASLIRPTAFFPAAVGTLLILITLYRSRILAWWQAALSSGIFLIGPVVHLATNFLRFGSWREFGYSLTISGFTTTDYLMRFSNPIKSTPLWDCLRELFYDLFFNNTLNGGNVYSLGLPGQSNAFRIREFYFTAFSPFTLLSLIALLAIVVFVRRSKNVELATLANLPLLRLAAMWGFPSCALLFAFYLRAPALASRYFADFAPEVSVLQAALVIFALRVFKAYLKRNVELAGLALVIVGLWMNIYTNQMDEMYSRNRSFREQEFAANMISEDNLMSQEQSLPSEYVCANGAPVTGIKLNFTGWKIPQSAADQSDENRCKVGPVTIVFLPTAPCYDYEFSKNIAYSGPPLSLDTIQVKRGPELLTLKERSTDHTNGLDVYHFRFCEQSSTTRNPHQIEALAIGWVDSSAFGAAPVIPYILSRIAAVSPTNAH